MVLKDLTRLAGMTVLRSSTGEKMPLLMASSVATYSWYSLRLRRHVRFEAIGLKVTAEQSFAMLRPGGVATIIGMVPFGTKIELHGADFLRDRKIQGTSMGGNRFRVDMPRLLELWRQGRLKLDTLVSGQVKLSEINEGFAMLKTGAPVRNLINFGVA